MSDTAIVYSGATGLPAALKDAYFTLYSSPVGNYIYKYHLMALEGTLEIPNDTSDLGSQLGQSLLTYIPYITTLDFSDCSYLTGTLDLSSMSNLRVLYASGTSLSADFGTGSGITLFSLGNPTSIVLKNPTSLAPAGVTVGTYGNLISLDLRNIPDTKTYVVFDKIFKTYMFGGQIIQNMLLNCSTEYIGSNPITESSSTYWVTSYIEITGGH